MSATVIEINKPKHVACSVCGCSVQELLLKRPDIQAFFQANGIPAVEILGDECPQCKARFCDKCDCGCDPEVIPPAIVGSRVLSFPVLSTT